MIVDEPWVRAVCFLAACAFCLVTPSIAIGYEPGDKVVVITESELRIPGEVQARLFPGILLKISEVKDEWIWVRHGRPGWLESKNVLPLEKAGIYFAALVRMSPSSSNFYARGLMMSATGKPEQALADLNEAIRRDPHQQSCYEARGFTWIDLGEYEKAISDFDDSLEINSGSPFPFVGRGIAYLESADLERAIRDFSEAIRLAPLHGQAYVYRGIVRTRHGQYDAALEDFETAISLDGQDMFAFRSRAQLHYFRGDYDKSLADFQVACRWDPTDAEAQNGRGVVWHAKGQYQEAIAAYSAAIEAQSDVANYYSNRGESLMEAGKYELALVDLDQAVKLNERLAEAFGHRAWLRSTSAENRFRDGKKAQADVLRLAAIRADRDHWFCRCVAAANAELGDFERALRWQKLAIAALSESRIPMRYKDEAAACLVAYERGEPYRSGGDSLTAHPAD